MAISLGIGSHEDRHILLLINLSVVQLDFLVGAEVAGDDSHIVNCRGRVEALVGMKEVRLSLTRHGRGTLAVDSLELVVMQVVVQVEVLVRIRGLLN